MKILHVVGARPNFMKIAPIIDAFQQHNKTHNTNYSQVLVHTGQHYDHKMSELFFEQLGIPKPDVNLDVGSGSHAKQTGQVMINFEPVLLKENPDLVIVVGDVNSTLACAIDSKKIGVPVAHVEAGLRSRDMSMPEEINRILTDAISDLLFTTDIMANANLEYEGINKSKIKFVGNVMIDTLLKHKKKALQRNTIQELNLLNLQGGVEEYAILTMHRPSNVDNKDVLRELADALIFISRDMRVVFPVHPRTLANLKKFGLDTMFSQKNNIFLIDPLGYLDFLNLMANAKLVLTDSGGIQEETTILNVPCLTMRNNTERPITVEQGTNQLVGTSSSRIITAYKLIRESTHAEIHSPDLWDGMAAQRIVNEINAWFDASK